LKINILKASIRRNPNAGKTLTVVPGRLEIKCTYTGKIPDYLKDLIQITTQRRSFDKTESVFYWIGEVPPQLLQDKNCRIEYKQEYIEHHHLPDPDYFFKYENPLIECSECKKKSRFEIIENDWVTDDCQVYICPNCESTDGYPEFEFQSIAEALSQREEMGVQK